MISHKKNTISLSDGKAISWEKMRYLIKKLFITDISLFYSSRWWEKILGFHIHHPKVTIGIWELLGKKLIWAIKLVEH